MTGPPDPPPPDESPRRPDDPSISPHLRYAAWARELQERAPQSVRRWWWPILAGLVGLGALIVVVALFTIGSDEPSAPATATPPPPASTSSPAPSVAPTGASTSAPSPPPDPGPEHSVPPRPALTHTVLAGDTLAALAARYGVPIEQLAADNALADPDRILTGQSLRIGTPPAGVQMITPGDTGCR